MREKIASVAITLLCMTGSTAAVAESYYYDGVVTLCTATCNDFASMESGATLSGSFEINSTPNDVFGDAEIGIFQIRLFNPLLPVSGPAGDPVNDNPMVLDSASGVAASNGTAGVTDAANQLNDGLMLIELLTPPFSENEMYIVYDLATGNGQFCLFYATVGCIAGATEIMKFEGSFVLRSGPIFEDGFELSELIAN